MGLLIVIINIFFVILGLKITKAKETITTGEETLKMIVALETFGSDDVPALKAECYALIGCAYATDEDWANALDYHKKELTVAQEK